MPEPMTLPHSETLQALSRAERETMRSGIRLDPIHRPSGHFVAQYASIIIARYEATLAACEAERDAIYEVLNNDGWDCSADPGHEKLAAKLEALASRNSDSPET